jgi:hypothetical protein
MPAPLLPTEPRLTLGAARYSLSESSGLILGDAVALLQYAFELHAFCRRWRRGRQSVSLPHCSLTLPVSCFQFPSIPSQSMMASPMQCVGPFGPEMLSQPFAEVIMNPAERRSVTELK